MIESSEKIGALDVSSRKCLFRHEASIVSNMTKVYSQEACIFECNLKAGLHKCRCVPWNYPSEDNSDICDVFGQACFENIMNQVSIQLN